MLITVITRFGTDLNGISLCAKLHHFIVCSGRGRSPRGRGSPRGGGRGGGMRGGRKVIIEPHRHEGWCHLYLFFHFFITVLCIAKWPTSL